MSELHATALVCTMNASPTPSTSQLIAQKILDELSTHGVAGELVRIADHTFSPGVQTGLVLLER